jgi:hypothetical protein
MSDGERVVLALVRDLLFASKITSAASQVGVSVQVVRNPAMIDEQPGRLLLVDLSLEGAVAAAGRWQRAHQGEVVGFVSHTDAATIALARQAGIRRIVARGAFVEQLPDLLRQPDPGVVRWEADNHPTELR